MPKGSKKMLCQVAFKYNQMMILIQQSLPIHFYSNSTDKNLTLALIGSYVEGA